MEKVTEKSGLIVLAAADELPTYDPELADVDRRDVTPVRKVGPFLVGENFVIPRVPIEQIDPLDIEAAFQEADRASKQLTWKMVDLVFIAYRRLNEEMWNIVYGTHSMGYVKNLRWIGYWWPPKYRVPGVSMSYHQVVTPLWSDAVRADDFAQMRLIQRWLADARDRGMSRDEFRDDVANNMLPPSDRDEPPQPMQLVIRPLDEPYKIAIQKCTDLKGWMIVNGGRHAFLNDGRNVLAEMDEIVKTLRQAARLAAKGYLYDR